MPDDAVYEATSQLASDAASIAMKGAVFGVIAGSHNLAEGSRTLRTAVSAAALAMERAGVARAEDLLDGRAPESAALHSALARMFDRDGTPRDPSGQDAARTLIADSSIQIHAQAILDGLEDGEKAKRLDLADRNVMEAVRDGGDLEQLVRRRASGAYHELTPDQQDDVAESISQGGMAGPGLMREVARAQQAAQMATASPRPGDGQAATLAGSTREALQRADALVAGARPSGEVETAVVAHARVFPDHKDEAAILARASAISAPELQPKSVYEIAVNIEHARRTIAEAQRRVATGTSTEIERHVAAGQGHRPDQQLSFHVEEPPALVRTRLAASVLDVREDGLSRIHEMQAARAQAGMTRS